MIELLNNIASKWFDWEFAIFWQVSILIAIIFLIDLLIRKWVWPQLRYALWMLILVKLVLPPTLTSPTSFTAEIPVLAKKAVKVQINQPEQLHEIVEDSESIVSAAPAIENMPIEADSVVEAVLGNAGETIAADIVTNSEKEIAFVKTSLSWKSYALLVWLIGVVVLMFWLIFRLRGLRREYLNDERQANLPERFNDLLAMVANRLKLRNIPRVILSDKVNCPAVFGVFRPILLMPADKLKNLTRRDAEHILLHELAHIKRGDLIIHALYMILQIAYWFNPLIWLIRKQLQNLRELCCDATVAKLLRENTLKYRETLLETARQLLAEPVDPGMGLLGLFENSNRLVERLKWLERKTWKNRRLRIASIFILVFLMATCVIPMTKFDRGAPDFVIKGKVTDAETGQPIVGAKVGDNDNYNDGEFFAITDSNGNYEYKTWYEEHDVVAEADGYAMIISGFKTKLFGSEKEKVVDFKLMPKKNVEQSELKANLSNGVTVELVGVCEHPSKGKQWWQGDGDRLGERLYDGLDISLGKDGDMSRYEVAVKFFGGEDVHLHHQNCEGMLSSSGMAAPYLENHNYLSNMGVLLFDCDDDRDTIDICIGAASGLWKKRFEINNDELYYGSSMSANGWGCSIMAARGHDGVTELTVSHDLADYQCRIVAIDKKDNLIVGQLKSGGKVGKVETSVVKFDMPIDQIKKVALQTRPYEWVTFKNISLHAGAKTNAKVEDSEEVGVVREFYLPNLNKSAEMIDLSSGEQIGIVETTSRESKRRTFLNSSKPGKGDLAYIFEGGKSYFASAASGNIIGGKKPTEIISFEPVKEFKFGELPVAFDVRIRARDYKVRVLRADENGCYFDYGLAGDFQSGSESKVAKNNKVSAKQSYEEVYVADGYSVDLPEIGKVELVSVCQFVGTGKRTEFKKLCWDPDGSKAEKPIYSSKPYWKRKDTKEIGLVFRSSKKISYKNLQDIKGLSKESKLNPSHSAYDENGRLIDDGNYFTYRGLVFDKDVIDFKLRIQPYKWSTIAEYDGKYVVGKIDKRVRFIEAYDSGDGVKVVFESDFDHLDDYEIQVDARYFEYDENNNKSNRWKIASVKSAKNAESKEVSVAVFNDLKLADTQVFRFQIRPKKYLLVEFKDVVVNPKFNADNETTSAAIEVENRSSEFKATLDNGVTVEFVGICQHPSADKQWWRPDGSILDERPYRQIKTGYSSSGYEVLFRVMNSDDFITKFKIGDNTSAMFGPFSLAENVEDIAIDNPQNLVVGFICFGKSSDVVNIDLLVGAESEWVTVVADSGPNFYGVAGNKVRVMKPIETNGKTTIQVAHTIHDKEVRLVVYNKKGKPFCHQTVYLSNKEDSIRPLHGTFDLALKEIQRIEVQTQEFKRVTFKNISLKSVLKNKVVKQAVELNSVKKTDTQANKSEVMEVDFEGYFEDSVSGGQELERLWKDKNKDLRDADEIVEIVRKGLRHYKDTPNMLRWVGSLFIWGKNPGNEKAIELMYHASGSPDRRLYGDAVYFGLSQVTNKTPEILRAMVAVAMKTDDYCNVTHSILWGCREQKEELINCLKPYLKSDDESVRKKAQDVKDYFVDSKAFMAKLAKQKEGALLQQYGGKLGEFKDSLLKGDSKKRLNTLKQMQSKGIMSIVDESFIDAFEACTKDSSSGVRSIAARMMGGEFVWRSKEQNQRVVEILTKLLDDSDHSTRYAAVYYGLSTVNNPSKELIRKMLRTILDDREVNYYGRVIWGISRKKQACVEILKEWMGQSKKNYSEAVKAYEIFEDVTEQRLPEKYAERFTGKKSDSHEGLVAMCFQNSAVSKENLHKQFIEILRNNDLIKKVLDFYITENRSTAIGMFICKNLSDRNEIRSALSKDGLFQVVGYKHGSIGPTGSGWIKSLSDFRKQNESLRVSLTDAKLQRTALMSPVDLNVKPESKDAKNVEDGRPKVLSVSPPDGTEMALVSQVKVVFDRPMIPEGFEIYDADMEEKYKHLSEIGTVESCVVYDANSYTFTVPLLLPCNWNGKVRLASFKSQDGLEMEPFDVNYLTLRKPFSDVMLKRFEKARNQQKLKEVLENIKNKRAELKSLQETSYSNYHFGEKEKEEQITFKIQGDKQFFADMSEKFGNSWVIGSDGQKCWFYNEYKDNKKLVELDYDQVDAKQINVCDAFKLSNVSFQEAAVFGNLEYAGTKKVDGKNYHLIRSWKSSVRMDWVDSSVVTWLIDAESYMTSQIIQESGRGKIRHRFEYERINEVFADSEFKPESVTDIKAEPEEELGEGYDKRFINIVDGTGTGRMSVRWGKRGSRGTSSSGLN